MTSVASFCGVILASLLLTVNEFHTFHTVLIVDFEQAKVCWVYIEKTNTFEDKIGYVVF